MSRSSLLNILLLPLCLALFFTLSLSFTLTHTVLPSYSLYDARRIIEWALLLFAACHYLANRALVNYVLRLVKQIPSWISLTAVALFVSGLIHTLVLPRPGFALLQCAFIVALALISAWVAWHHHQCQQTADKHFLLVITISMLSFLITTLIVYAKFHWHPQSMNAIPGFMNPRFFSQFQVWTLPLSIVLISVTPAKDKLIKVAAYALCSLWWTLAFIAHAKGAIIAALFAMALVYGYFWRDSLTIIKRTLLCLMIGFACFFALTTVTTHTANNNTAIQGTQFNSTSSSISGRTLLWQQSLKLISDHPSFGVGPMHYAYYEADLPAHPHNSLLLIGSEWGLPALLFCLLLWFLAARKSIQHITQVKRQSWQLDLQIALTASMLAGFSYSLISGVFITPLSQMMMCVLIGWQVARVSKIDDLEPVTTIAKIGFYATVLLTIATLLYIVVPTLTTLSQQEIQWLASHQFNATFRPRMWLQGWIK